MIPTVSVLILVPGKTVSTVPICGDGSVPAPFCANTNVLATCTVFGTVFRGLQV